MVHKVTWEVNICMHGYWHPRNGYFELPPGCSLVIFGGFGKQISQTVVHQILEGRWGSEPDRIVRPGSHVPNFLLKPTTELEARGDMEAFKRGGPGTTKPRRIMRIPWATTLKQAIDSFREDVDVKRVAKTTGYHEVVRKLTPDQIDLPKHERDALPRDTTSKRLPIYKAIVDFEFRYLCCQEVTLNRAGGRPAGWNAGLTVKRGKPEYWVRWMEGTEEKERYFPYRG